MAGAVAEFAEGAGMEASMRRGLDAFFRVVEDPLLARVMWQEIVSVSGRAEQAYLENMERNTDLLLTLMEGMRPGFRRTQENRLIARSAVGGVSYTSMVWVMNGYRLGRKTVVNASM